MQPMIFNATLYDIRVRRDGGRLQLDFGGDALPVITKIMELGTLRDQNFQIAIMQVDQETESSPEHVDFDLENEIQTCPEPSDPSI